jgi:hypothetical protein
MADTAKQAKISAIPAEIETKAEGAGALPDPFDLSKLALNPSTLPVVKAVRAVLTGKPNPHEFFRVHPNPDYRMTFGMFELKDGQQVREEFLVAPDLVPVLDGETVIKQIYTCINRAGIIRLWPVRLPRPDEKDSLWWQTAHAAADKAMTQWVRIKANMGTGANEYHFAESHIPDPDWKEVAPFKVLLQEAYRNRVIQDLDHPALKKMRGA